MSTVTLPSGAEMPLLGLGTWRLTGDVAGECTAAAIAAGYRHVDTATMYANEREVGSALVDGVFVTTKLQPTDFGQARRTLEDSLHALGRIDLWLQHWPGDDNVAIWGELVKAQQDRLVTDIGVSNYSLAQLDEVTAATGVQPAVNQIPWSPLRFDRAVLEGHRERGVVLEGYSGLRGGVLDHPVVTQIAASTGRTPAQVVLRWHVQHGVVVIPRSKSPERIVANADLGFVLSERDMTALDALGG